MANCIAIVYKTLGLEPKMILALAGVYGILTFISNVLTTKYLTDQWGRRKYVNSGHCVETFAYWIG